MKQTFLYRTNDVIYPYFNENISLVDIPEAQSQSLQISPDSNHQAPQKQEQCVYSDYKKDNLA
jgi:hypothetical protein